jgi:glycosyltransferase involved in cell wall biosynthesis
VIKIYKIKRRSIFYLIGNQIFSKGGKESVSVISRLCNEGFNIKLTIISILKPDSYATRTTKNDIKRLKQEIDKNSNAIELLGCLPNDKVLNILKESQVLLLPTYADTYGYSVLEAQASGCPVVSTDIRALPEINNNQCGWIINVPKDKFGNGILESKENIK